MNIFGFNWRIGRHWGVVHPEHNCWNDDISVKIEDNRLYLGIDYDPVTFADYGRKEYSVGYVSSIDTIKYGHLKVEYILPIGRNLWPAIWLTDARTWPPEIDIMEAWSNHYFCKALTPKAPARTYRRNPFANSIFPSLHLGSTPSEHVNKSYTKLGGSPSCYIDVMNTNTCDLWWADKRIVVEYNGHKMMDVKDSSILEHFNHSMGMEIHLNNYITNGFTHTDLVDLDRNNFIIQNLIYEQ
jgi:hypothetical protein